MQDPLAPAKRILRSVQRRLGLRSNKSVFTDHFNDNTWQSDESVSGLGSTLEYTENIRREIPRLVARLDARSVLDAPCGDYNWFGKIAFDRPIDYVGGDIVDALVKRNQSRFGTSHVNFRSLDITRDPLPKADVWLCRDCLFHLSYRDIHSAIENFLRSDVRYWLTTTHIECAENSDIQTGGFRLLDLRLPPFNFPPPRATMDDWIEGYPKRHLALWERIELAAALRKG